MSKGKEIFLLILGGIGWLMYGIALILGGALDNGTGVWLCVASLVLGLGLFSWGMDKLLEPRKRW